MAGWFAGEIIKINKQIVIGKRLLAGGESDDYHARIWLKKSRKYKYINLETRLFEDAKLQALIRFGRLVDREEEGLAVFQTTIANKLNDFELWYLKRAVSKDRKTLVRNQILRFKEYFGTRNVTSITVSEFHGYIDWRRLNNRRGAEKGISNGVLTSEGTLLGMFFGHLANNGVIREGLYRALAASDWSKTIGRKEQRGALTVEQFRELRKYLEFWHLENKLDDRARYTRQCVHWLVRIAGRTGLRTIELKNLRWEDIKKHGKGCMITARGKGTIKNERSRDVHSDAGVFKFFMNIRRLVADQGLGVANTDSVFVKHNGKPAGDLWSQNIKIAFRKLGMEVDSKNRRNTLYSLRHYFANRQITAGVQIFDLAEYMGTSVSMISLFYGKPDSEELGMRVMGPQILKKMNHDEEVEQVE